MINILTVTTIPLIIPIICFVVGVILLIIETFTPGFGLFGFLGALCLVAGIVLRIISGGTFWELFITIVLVLALIITLLVIVSKSARTGKLSKSPLVLSENAVSQDITEGTKDYTYLLGKIGVTTTFLRPVGKAKFQDETIDVICEDSEIIESGTQVKVTLVEGQKVAVIKVK